MTTPKLQLPELSVGQAGKELTHNQALAILSQLVQANVVDKDLAAPPGSPADGAMYIVASGNWGTASDKSGKLAFWLASVDAWTFATPVNGWRVWVSDESAYYTLTAGAWTINISPLINPMTTAGDLIVGGASGAPTRLAKGTNGQVLKMVSGAEAWGVGVASIVAGSNITIDSTDPANPVVSSTGGGGGGAVGLSQYPAASVPAAGAAGGGVLVTDKGLLLYDNGAAYSAYGPIDRLYSPPATGWSWVNQGAAAVVSSDFDQAISGGGSGTGASIRGRFRAIPGGAYTLTACLQITMLAKTFQSGGIALRDSVSGKIIVCALLSGASGTQNIQYAKFNSPTSFAADYFAPSVSVGGKIWLRIVDNGTNRITLFSVDGISFLEIYTVGCTDFITPNEIGFVMSTENSATPNLAPIVRLISWQIA